jgi:hypothetical protein
MKRIYLSGPMSGLPDMNYPAFNAEATRLRAMGFHVENPAENPEQSSWEDYMKAAIIQMLSCEVVVMLPGWSESRGALIERELALRLGLKVISAGQEGSL